MNEKVYLMLKTQAESDKAKALLTIDLLTKVPAGIGDHSGGDFYKNAEDALKLLASADERLETLEKYFNTKEILA